MRSVNQWSLLSKAARVGIAGLALGLGSVAYGQGQKVGGAGQPAVAVQMDVTFNGHSRPMMVDGADGAVAQAGVLTGVSPVIPLNYKLYNKVIVHSDDLALVKKALETVPGYFLQTQLPSVEVVSDLPGWSVVQTGTVGEAIEVAQRLRSMGLFDSVTVEMQEPLKNMDVPSDPMVPDQWHLLNLADPDADLNVSEVYAQGITGDGVLVGVLEAFDDNFQPDHPDLAANLNTTYSMETTPFWTVAGQSHGTSVAGIIGAVANNGIGVAGVAYDAELARLRNGPSLVQAQAFEWYWPKIFIKNNSWGPVNPLGSLPAHVVTDHVMNALERAATKGRGGKGTVFVFSAGNARLDGEGITGVMGTVGDRCDYQPRASNRRTIAVGAVLDNNQLASYSNTGNSLLVSAYSGPGASDPPTTRGIVTTDSDSGYTSTFNGTSASAPVVSGVIALMLEANPSLSVRDVQHILKETSRVINFTNGSVYFPPLGGDTWWQVNGGFTRHSDEYGFGLIDAEAAVSAARSWVPLREEKSLDTFTIPLGLSIPDDGYVEVDVDTYIIAPTEIRTAFCIRPNFNIESMEVILNTTGNRRGDLWINLYSPWGSFSSLAIPRYDLGTGANYQTYTFTTLKHWDEGSAGVWQIGMSDWIPDSGPQDTWAVDWAPWNFQAFDGGPSGEQTWVDYRVVIHGTAGDPDDYFLCDPATQSCPADLNGHGVVDVRDLQLFLELYYAGDPFADLTLDGNVNWADLQAYMAIWVPGFCDGAGDEGPGGRPMNGGGGSGRPVGPPGA